MRKLVKLVLYFSLSFAILFLVSVGMRFLAIHLEWVRTLPRRETSTLTGLIAAARWALSLALYGGILLGLSYTVRTRVFAPCAIFCIIALAAGFACGISELLYNWEKVPPAKTKTSTLGGPGLILSGTPGASGTTLVLLRGPAEAHRARVVAVPGEPMLYQAEFAGRDTRLPPAPFADTSPWFMKSLAIDIKLNAENLQRLFGEGLLPFLTYVGALIILLSSLLVILKFSVWPLANLFLGCLAFRGILALETFFNSPEMQEVFDSFLQNRIPVTLAVPLIFCGIGLLAHLYYFFVYLAKRQGNYGD